MSSRGDAYLEDNVALNRDGGPAPLTRGRIVELNEKPVWPDGLRPLPPETVVDYVSKHAGARPRDRDEVDKRIIRDLLNRQGRIIDSQDDVGGYPDHRMTRHKIEVPAEDIQAWLKMVASQIE